MTPDPKGCFNYGRRMSRSSGDLVQCGCPACLSELDERERFSRQRTRSGPFDRGLAEINANPTPLEAAIQEAVKDIH